MCGERERERESEWRREGGRRRSSFLGSLEFQGPKGNLPTCKNDCVLFFKEHVDKEECPTCKTSRWANVKSKGKKIPHKVLRYFPIKPRLQRLFMSKDITKDMRWHKDGRQDDENLRHPANLILWKEFD
jgi:hypothetical protein